MLTILKQKKVGGQMMTVADKEGRGGWGKADNG